MLRAFLIAALVMVAAAAILFIVRTELVHRIRMRRVDDSRGDPFALVRFANGPSFHACFWDWRKWTYRAFYPDAP